jgi:hypothetical protein
VAQSSGEAVTERKRIERINIEEILLQEAASHGTASWVFEQVLFLAGLISLFRGHKLHTEETPIREVNETLWMKTHNERQAFGPFSFSHS